MANNKFYYQILVVLPRKSEKLLFWVRNDKIDYSTKDELITFVKNNFKELKKYKHIVDLMVMEVEKSHLDELEKWYIEHSKPREYVIIYD